jgi:ubiquinone/menaquinone biosynthesis C-methylase UbiE
MATDEVRRIKEAYARRDSLGKSRLYSYLSPAALFLGHQRERAIVRTLKESGLEYLAEKKILDVGCGNGGVLRDFMRYGATPENCCGIDLLPDRIDAAKNLSPNLSFCCGNAETLPYESGYFDIVISFTLFTSVLDAGMRLAIVAEMLRVLKPGGIVLWYDYHVNNPSNPDVRGVTKKEIFSLFHSCEIRLKRTTLAPPIARALAPHSYLACYLLEKIKLFNTHYIGYVRKRKSTDVLDVRT